MVLDKHAQKNKIKMDELEKKYKKLLLNIEEIGLKKNEEYFDLMKKKGNQDGKKIISRAKIASQNEILVNKSKMLASFNEYLHEEIKEFISSDKYDAFFIKNLEEAMKNFTEGDELRIIVRENDKKHIDETRMDIEISDELLGGFYIIANENIKYDYSIEGKLMESSDYIGCLIQSLMTNKAGESDESE